MDRVLILGHTGKLGRALAEAFASDFEVVGRSGSTGLNAEDTGQVRQVLESTRPTLVLNALALNGLDACERDPEKAFQINALHPRHLATCSRTLGFRLVHFSTDAVFDGKRSSGCYVESDAANPINAYGMTKFAGDRFVQAEAEDAFVFRLSVLAGAPGGSPQLIEKMIARARAGEALSAAEDIVCSPSTTKDVADAVHRAVQTKPPGGLYHLANAGSASLFQLFQAIVEELGLQVPVHAVSHRAFSFPGHKTLYTPLASEKGATLRPWREAIRDYCRDLKCLDGPSSAGSLQVP